MTKYLLKRIAILLVTLWVVVTLSFFLMQVMPGSPFNNPKLTNDMIAVMNKQYGLDKPVWQQYLQYLWNVLHGDLGTSYQSANQPVSMMISQRLAVSAQLGIQALVVGVLAGLFVGAVSARNKNNWIDNILSVLSTLGISVPSFIIGLLLLDYLGFKWGVLPLSGWGSFSQTILPTLALAIPVFAQVTRFFRSEMIETMNTDFIQLARAKGLTARQISNRHAYRNSMIPVLTLIGPMAANILTGSALIEQIFSIPGIGQQFVTSIAGNTESQEKIEKPTLSFTQDAWRRLKKNKLATISLWFLAILLVFSIGSNFFVKAKDANSFNGDEVKTYRNLPPKISDSLPFWNGSIVFSGNTEPNDVYSDQSVPKGDKFILGTDNLGRSLAKRVIVGIRISLLIAIVATLIDLIIGVTYGLVSGFLGGKIDLFMQRVIEVISSIPNLVIVTMLGLLLGNGVMSIIISIAIVGWTSMARQVRNLTLSYREREFVLASRALGENKFKIAFKHVLPNISGIIIVQIMMTVPSAIMYEAVLSAINLGVKPPTASLGSLITDASENLQYYPYQVVIPALALVFISLAFILLGDGLRDAFDPKSNKEN